LENYYVATFHSVSRALRFEKMLLSQGVTVKLIPVPRVLSSSCGIAARFGEDVCPLIIELVQTGLAELEGVYRFTHLGKKAQAESCPGPWDNGIQ
jgi:hypothetical protein